MKVREESELDLPVRVLSHLGPRGEEEAAEDPLAKLQSEEGQDELPAELGLLPQGVDDPLLDDDDVEVEESLHREDREAPLGGDLIMGSPPGYKHIAKLFHSKREEEGRGGGETRHRVASFATEG